MCVYIYIENNITKSFTMNMKNIPNVGHVIFFKRNNIYEKFKVIQVRHELIEDNESHGVMHEGVIQIQLGKIK